MGSLWYRKVWRITYDRDKVYSPPGRVDGIDQRNPRTTWDKSGSDDPRTNPRRTGAIDLLSLLFVVIIESVSSSVLAMTSLRDALDTRRCRKTLPASLILEMKAKGGEWSNASKTNARI